MFSTLHVRALPLWAVCLALTAPSAVLAQGAASKVTLPKGKAAGKATNAKPGKSVPPTPAEIAALANQDLEVAARAAETLGNSSSPVAHDALIDALALGTPPEVAVPAIRAVASHPVATDVAALSRYAHHVNPSVRSVAIVALANYAASEAQQVIVARLGDQVLKVRAAAADAAARAKVRSAIDPMLVLLVRGEEGPAHSIAAMADPDLTRRVAELIGKAPEPVLAMCLGEILRRPDFGPDTARVEVVRAIGKIADPSAMGALVDYLDNSPKNENRTSQQEAKLIVDARRGGR